MSKKTIYQDLKQLGHATALPQTPEEAVLEAVENPQQGVDYMIRFTAPSTPTALY